MAKARLGNPSGKGGGVINEGHNLDGNDITENREVQLPDIVSKFVVTQTLSYVTPEQQHSHFNMQLLVLLVCFCAGVCLIEIHRDLLRIAAAQRKAAVTALSWGKHSHAVFTVNIKDRRFSDFVCVCNSC